MFKNSRLRVILLVVLFAALFVVSYNYFTYQQGFRIVDESELETPAQPPADAELAQPGDTTEDSVVTGSKTDTAVESGDDSQATMDAGDETATTVEPDATAVLAGLAVPVEGPILQNPGWYFSDVLQEWRYHAGVDIEAEPDTAVRAALAGVVDRVEYLEGYGSTVVLNHAATIQTVYSGLGFIGVEAGDKVDALETIGTIGEAPVAEEPTPHLHFEVLVSGEPASVATFMAK